MFYAQHFSRTHERIRPQELFQADPSLGLRAVILNVVNILNKVGLSEFGVGGEESEEKREQLFLCFHIFKFSTTMAISCGRGLV